MGTSTGSSTTGSSQVHFERARAALSAWDADPASQPAVAEVFEAHIFCAPLNPDPEQVAAFEAACARLGIKALCLGLDYVERGVVDVLQSTKYYRAEGPREPVAQMLADAAALGEEFEVIRLKLEAMASDPGVPRSDLEMAAMNASRTATGTEHYFEFHVKLAGQPITPENDERLKALAAELTAELGVKIPFSKNSLPPKNQRFLNARTYGQGFTASRQVAQRVAEAVERRGFTVAKVIEEFIVFDTNKDLDRGWLEF